MKKREHFKVHPQKNEPRTGAGGQPGGYRLDWSQLPFRRRLLTAWNVLRGGVSIFRQP